MVQGSLNPNVTFLGEKLWTVAWEQILLVLYKGQKSKYKANIKRKNENFEKKIKMDHSTIVYVPQYFNAH